MRCLQAPARTVSINWASEQQNPAIRLIYDDGQVQELVNRNALLQRTGNAEALPRFEGARERIHDRNRFADGIDRQNSASLRI